MNNRDSKEQTTHTSDGMSYLINLDEFILPYDDEDVNDVGTEGLDVGGYSHRVNYRFIKGPIDLLWMQRASECSGRSGMVGIILWYMAGLEKGLVVEVKNKLLAEFGISRQVAYECYERLEAAGLIKRIKRHGKRPVIEILLVSHPDGE